MLLTKRVNPTYNISNQDDSSEYCKELLYLLLAKPNAVHAVYNHIERCPMVEARGKRRRGGEGGRRKKEGGRRGGGGGRGGGEGGRREREGGRRGGREEREGGGKEREGGEEEREGGEEREEGGGEERDERKGKQIKQQS